MLLGSPPDMVHSRKSHKTHLSTQSPEALSTTPALIPGYHPCFSGFQVQGSATSPAGMVLFIRRSAENMTLQIIVSYFYPLCKYFEFFYTSPDTNKSNARLQIPNHVKFFPYADPGETSEKTQLMLCLLSDKFTENYTQTVKQAADSKSQYAPAEAAYRLLYCPIFPNGSVL